MAKKSNKQATTNTPVVKKPSETKIASTIVELGPNNGQARKDGYGKANTPLSTSFDSSLSKYTDDFMKSFTSLSSALGLGGLNLKSLSGLEGVKDVFDKIDPEKMKKRIEDNLLGGRSMESIVGLTKDFQRDAIGTLTKLSSGYNIAGMDIGNMIKNGDMLRKDAIGIYNIVKNGDWASLQGITSALGKIGGGKIGELLKPIVDLQATSAFLGTMIQKITQLGLPNLINEVSGMFQSKRDRNRALSAAVYNAAMRSDIYMMKDILKVLGSNEFTNNNPKVIEWVLANYKLDIAYETSKIKEYRKELIDLLNEIDPEWYYDMINGEKVTKLKVFNKVSKDAAFLLRQPDEEGNDFKVELMIAKNYQEQDIKRLVMLMYKDIRFKNRPLDPRQKH